MPEVRRRSGKTAGAGRLRGLSRPCYKTGRTIPGNGVRIGHAVDPDLAKRMDRYGWDTLR